ncbi:MAG: ribosome maturation factor RimM [Spirochaetaceae bacterium]|jgi:16S rRNA processing protein RimM|nr:ribosome maturation factor RimM [Spirochaetaceae bacterium]
MERLVVGIVRSPHGLSGTFKFASASGEYGHFAGLTEVVLRGRQGERSYPVERVAPSASLPLMKLRGVDSPEQAKLLSGSEILVPREQACPLKEGEYYVEDLKGCVLVHHGGGGAVEAGVITAVIQGGGGSLLEVAVNRGASGRAGEAVFVPFNREFIGDVDLAARRVELKHTWILE